MEELRAMDAGHSMMEWSGKGVKLPMLGEVLALIPDGRRLFIEIKCGPEVLLALEQVLKASHTFNLLDARGAISVTERVGIIARIRILAVGIAKAYSQMIAQESHA